MGHRHGWDPALLWLWHRLVAIGPIRSLVWEPPYAMEAAPEKAKRKKKKKNWTNRLMISINFWPKDLQGIQSGCIKHVSA